MGRKLTKHVHIQGNAFRPGDELPDELAKLVTNPAAFEVEAPEVAEDPAPPEVPAESEAPAEAKPARPARRTATPKE